MPNKLKHECELEKETLQQDVTSGYCARLAYRLNGIILASETNQRLILIMRSVAGIRAEKRRQRLDPRYKYTIHPFSKLRVFWETVMLFVYLISYFLIPFSNAYKNHGIKMRSMFVLRRYELNITFVLNILCMIDIGMNFNTGYYIKDPLEIVLDKHKIASRYLRSYFVVDLLHSLPLQFFFVHTIGEYLGNSPDWDGQPHMFIAMGLSMLRVFRAKTVITYLKRFCELIRLTISTSRVVRAAVIISMWVHFSACFTYGVPFIVRKRHVDSKKEDNLRQFGGSWINMYNTSYGTLLYKYTSSLFHVSHVYTGVGVCDPKAYPMIEDLLTLSVMGLFSIITSAYLFSTYFHISTHTSQGEVKYMDVMNQLKMFLSTNKVPEDLQDKFFGYYNYRFNGRYFNEHSIFSSLPAPTRRELKMYTCRHLVENVAIFFYLPRDVLVDIVDSLHLEVFMPNDVILRANTPGSCMYFLSSGTVAVLMATGKEICHLVDGAHFGEVCLVQEDHLRIASVIALEPCEVYRLERSDFERCIAKFPELHVMVASVAKERLEYAFMLNEAHKQKLIRDGNVSANSSFMRESSSTVELVRHIANMQARR